MIETIFLVTIYSNLQLSIFDLWEYSQSKVLT